MRTNGSLLVPTVRPRGRCLATLRGLPTVREQAKARLKQDGYDKTVPHAVRFLNGNYGRANETTVAPMRRTLDNLRADCRSPQHTGVHGSKQQSAQQPST